MSSTIKVESVGPMFLLFIVFLVLKLTEFITWSWWWITAPLWGPIAIALAILPIVILFVWIGHSRQSRRRRR